MTINHRSLLLLGMVHCHFCFLDSNALPQTVSQKDKVNLTIIQVIDKRLPKMSNKDLSILLRETTKLCKVKFGIDVAFSEGGVQSVNDFFKNKLNYKTEKDLKNTSSQFNLWNASFSGVVSGIHRFIVDHDLSHIRHFFPENISNQINTYKDAAYKAASIYLKNLDELKKMTLNNQNIFHKHNYKYHSALYWQAAFLKIKKPYFVITNECILDDIYFGLHTSMHFAVINGTRGLLSTCPMYIDTKYFIRKRGEIPSDLKPKVLAELLTHEIGHVLFKFRDIYDPELAGCVMQINKETLPSFTRYWKVINHSPCPNELQTGKTWVSLNLIRTLVSEGQKEKARNIEQTILEENSNNFHGLLLVFDHFVDNSRPSDAAQIIPLMLKTIRKEDKHVLPGIMKYCNKSGLQKEEHLVREQIKVFETHEQ